MPRQRSDLMPVDPTANPERKNLKRSDPRNIVAKLKRRGKITRRDRDIKGPA